MFFGKNSPKVGMGKMYTIKKVSDFFYTYLVFPIFTLNQKIAPKQFPFTLILYSPDKWILPLVPPGKIAPSKSFLCTAHPALQAPCYETQAPVKQG